MTMFKADRRWMLPAVILLVAFYVVPSAAQQLGRGSYTPSAAQSINAIVAEHGMVVAQEKTAAAIGGGGFMLIHSADHHEDVAIDYRETAPAATTAGIFLGPDGKPDITKSRDS